MQSTVPAVPKGSLVAKVSLLSPQQAQFLQPIIPELINERVNESINDLIANSGFFHHRILSGFRLREPAKILKL